MLLLCGCILKCHSVPGGEPGNDGDEDNFDNERQKLQRKASKDVKKLMKEQERELAKVAKQVKDKKRKRMRNSKAASKRNVDKKSFVQAVSDVATRVCHHNSQTNETVPPS